MTRTQAVVLWPCFWAGDHEYSEFGCRMNMNRHSGLRAAIACLHRIPMLATTDHKSMAACIVYRSLIVKYNDPQ